jgi:hypothetical protein
MKWKTTRFLLHWFSQQKHLKCGHSSSDPVIIADSCTKQIYALAQFVETSLKVAGLIPDDVIGFFSLPNPSSRTVVIGSTQPLTEMSTRISLRVKGGRRISLTTWPPSVRRILRKCGGFDYSQPYGTSRSLAGVALLFHYCTKGVRVF